LIESAYFFPMSVRKTSKKLGLGTEASYRFERGIDLSGVDFALRRATKLMAELTGGTVARGILDVFPRPYTPLKVPLRTQRVQTILGIAVNPAEMTTILSSLGFGIAKRSGQAASQDLFEVEVPAYRPDVTREIDLIEEVARMYGYDNIPTRLPSGEIPPKAKNMVREVEQQVKNLLVSQGLSEVINYSFFDQKSLDQLALTDQEQYNKSVPVKNPLSADQNLLRTTNIPGLLRNIVLNRSHRAEHIRFFEIGKVFVQTDPAAPLPDEHTLISGVITGSRMEVGWTHQQESVNFYDVKGILERMLQALGIVYEFRRTEEVPFLHPGEAAAVYADHESLGFVGKLHPDVVDVLDLDDDRVYLFELSLKLLAAHSSLQRTFRSLPKFPAVHRDLAVVVQATTVQAAEVEAIITEAGKPLLEKVVLFDRYVGPQIAAGCVGLTYALIYRSCEKTLTDEEVTQVHQCIIEQLHARLGVVLRQ
jgi:phenylalanyl-tRNA synthetase beta chain